MPSRLTAAYRSLAYNEFVAELMKFASANDWASFKRVLDEDQAPAILRYDEVPETSNYPRYMVVSGRDFQMAATCGVSRLSHATQLLRNYYSISFTGDVVSTYDINPYVNAYAAEVKTVMDRQSLDPLIPRHFIGHSLGGACAELLTCYRELAGYSAQTFGTTFGGVKWTTGPAAKNFGRRCQRWMNDTDPVPLVPFGVSTCPTVIAEYHLWILNAFLQYRHCSGGLNLNDDGTFEDAILPENATVRDVVNMAAWLLSVETQGIAGHAMSEYYERLVAASDRATDVFQGYSGEGGSYEAPETRTSRYYNQIEARVATTVSNQQAAQNAAVLSIPPDQLFRVVRQGRLYVVAFGSSTVALTACRRTARSLCRQFNQALRHLQSTAFVDPASFLSRLEEYFGQAANTSGAFTPVMQTQLTNLEQS